MNYVINLTLDRTNNYADVIFGLSRKEDKDKVLLICDSIYYSVTKSGETIKVVKEKRFIRMVKFKEKIWN